MKKVVFGGFWKAAVQGAGMSACILRLRKLEPVSFAAALVALVLLFSGCDQGTGGSSPGQTGTVTLTIGFKGGTSSGQESYSLQNVLRTVHPETSAITDRISRYEVTFKPGSGTAIGPVELDPENPRPVTLTVGTYTVTVTAFEDDGANGYTAIAEGVEEDVPVVKGQNTTADVLLGPKAGTGTGTLGYDITVSTNVESAKIIITPAGGGTVPDLSLSPGANNGTVTLPSGVYTVFVSLVKNMGVDSAQYAGSSKVVYIYKGFDVALPAIEYTDSNFPELKMISLFDLSNTFDAPAAGARPANAITAAAQYSGSITWKQGSEDFNATEFDETTTYTAVLTLTPVAGYTFTGVGADVFSYDGATSVTNVASSNVVTIVFPATDQFSGQGGVNLGFPSGSITIISSAAQINPGNTAAQGESPTRLVFYILNEYTNVAWYVDGNPVPASSGRGIMINPNDYTVKSHTLNVIGTRKGMPSSGSIEFTVKEAGTAEALTLIDLDNLTDYLAALPANTVDEPHLVSLASFSVSDTAKWETLKTALDTLDNKSVYINLDLRACTATGNTITGLNGAGVTSSHFNYITYATVKTKRLVGLVLPSTLTTVGDYALHTSKSLRSITIPSGVTAIGDSAFKECENLTSITIPASVQSIGAGAFTTCGSVTRVILEGVPNTLINNYSLPRELRSDLNGPGIYEYVNGSWSKVD
jgi:hypothetical protein